MVRIERDAACFEISSARHEYSHLTTTDVLPLLSVSFGQTDHIIFMFCVSCHEITFVFVHMGLGVTVGGIFTIATVHRYLCFHCNSITIVFISIAIVSLYHHGTANSQESISNHY